MSVKTIEKSLKKPNGIENRLSDRFYPTALLMMGSNGKIPIEIVAKHNRQTEFGKYLMENMKSDFEYMTNSKRYELLEAIARTNGNRDELIKKV